MSEQHPDFLIVEPEYEITLIEKYLATSPPPITRLILAPSPPPPPALGTTNGAKTG